MFGFNITLVEAIVMIVGPIIILRARWVVKNIKFAIADFFIPMIYFNSDFNFRSFQYIHTPKEHHSPLNFKSLFEYSRSATFTINKSVLCIGL